MGTQRLGLRLPIAYRAFFLLVEPISAVIGAIFCHFRQRQYLQLLDAASGHSQVPLGTSVALSQLANMYLFFALNEALVLRSTWNLRVWRTVLAVLLVADIGHLYALKELGLDVYFKPAGWNMSHLANIPWVCAGAALRACFLAGVGLQDSKRSQRRQ